ncbi:MAG: IS110 family transposase [bacterium]
MPPIKIRYVGLDVHKDSISIAVAESGQSEPRFLGKFSPDWAGLQKQLKKIGEGYSLKICYEAGPTGYHLYRRLLAESYECDVIAPSKIPKRPGDRVKTDRRDATQLARCLRAGDLTPIHVPDPETEALRDLVRNREAAKRAEITAKNQLSKFLLRYDLIYSDGGPWTQKHFIWLRSLKFAQEAQQIAFQDCLETVETTTARVNRLTTEIERLVPKSSHAPLIIGLKALRGIQTVSAVVIAAELGDLRRFPAPERLMSYVGLCPSENSSGSRLQKGSITKTGNHRVRRILVEAAWNYRTPRAVSELLRQRMEAASPEARKISVQAIHRLQSKFRHLLIDKNKNSRVAVVAVARELAGFIWAIGQLENPVAPQAAAANAPQKRLGRQPKPKLPERERKPHRVREPAGTSTGSG